MIWNFLPEIYKETRKKELFSYKRYFIWSVNGVIVGSLLYYIVRLSLSSVEAANVSGHVSDANTLEIINGINLVGTVMLVSYMDMKVRTYFF